MSDLGTIALMIALAALTWAATSNLTKMALIDGTIGTSLEIVVWYSIVGWILLTPWMLAEVWQSGIPIPSIAEWMSVASVSYTHLTLPTKRIV